MQRCPTPATVKTPAQNFTGDVYLDPVFRGDGTSELVVGLVRFTPGARTNWHSHANGQLLRCTDGVGLVVTRDGAAIRIQAGDAVWTPAGAERAGTAAAPGPLAGVAVARRPSPATASAIASPATISR